MTKHIPLAIGAGFFFVMAAIGYFSIFKKKSEGIIRAEYFPLVLPSAEGLKQGAAVNILGVPSGSVESLHVLRNSLGEPEVTVILALNRPVVFFPNYKAVTRYPTALAAKVVEIDPGARDRKKGPLDEEDRSLPRSLTPQQLISFKKTGELPDGSWMHAANYDDPLFLIATVVTENRKQIRKITSNLAQITDKINNGQGTIAALINRSDIVDGTNELLKGIIIAIQDVREGVEDTRESRAMIDFISIVTAAF